MINNRDGIIFVPPLHIYFFNWDSMKHGVETCFFYPDQKIARQKKKLERKKKRKYNDQCFWQLRYFFERKAQFLSRGILWSIFLRDDFQWGCLLDTIWWWGKRAIFSEAIILFPLRRNSNTGVFLCNLANFSLQNSCERLFLKYFINFSLFC